MSVLAKFQAERTRLSPMDRRIADFIVANAPLLRDYSSQQLADALHVSQSSIVKFAQRTGFKGLQRNIRFLQLPAPEATKE